MGILNVTPDSFSDGGNHESTQSALQQALKMAEDGAAIIDVGGESTRPGAAPVSLDEELQRVIPVIEAIRKVSEVSISVDSGKPEVMRAAIAAGADWINDIYALRKPGALAQAAALECPLCLMHMQGRPGTMQQAPHYNNVVDEVLTFLSDRIAACEAAGIARSRIWVDPGFGFGKRLEHNLQLLSGLDRFRALNVPLLVGISRKSMVGELLGGREVGERLFGSVGAAVVAVERGANIVRVHDVGETHEALMGAGLMRGSSA
ncbi:MAG: dihydropteroate synthase [Gammaproteobacteria bacterium]|nr:dihydropteroate synthase [Gammaproteobacteria bacterium]MBT7309065.1 dihydropteroate synthase [Gammaproteobacteria bacterium]